MKSLKFSLSITAIILSCTTLLGQPDRWQQKVEYLMNIDMDVNTHRFTGKQKLDYYNNSPDALSNVYYHLYFNAFQSGSMMDVRSGTINDPDRRVLDRISNLKDNEIGYLRVKSLKVNGKIISYKEAGTILEVSLDQPIMPNSKVTFEMEFDGQVPVQIRRSGRDNKEGIAYSMAQWYPKMAEYDYEGWHANPYVGREFYGVWGDFDVSITIDPDYMVAATGFLQNPNKIGFGYEDDGITVKPSKKDITWNFIAENVHDFVWTADPDYTHIVHKMDNGTKLHFFYQEDSITESTWKQLPSFTERAMLFMNETFGEYPYKKYSVIQGGDGGMEYPMATLITGQRNLRSLVGVTVHELIHSWFQMVLGTNESLYPWMDEGFTSFASALTSKHLYDPTSDRNPYQGSYSGYFFIVNSGKEEPMTTHSDHYNENRSYGIAAYSKGAVILNQLNYVMGNKNFFSAMKRYYNTWKFKHPNVTDFKRIMEKESNLELDWYFEQFINTTNKIDYGIKTVLSKSNSTYITLEKVENMMMPIDMVVEYQDGSKELYYIPLRIMRGEKPKESIDIKRVVVDDWPWTHPTYNFTIPRSDIKSIEIDPTQRMADINRDNNRIIFPDDIKGKVGPDK